MDIIFLGYMVPIEQMQQYSGISVAGNKMQFNVMNELNKLTDVHVHSVSMAPYACYPNDKHIVVKKKQYGYSGIICTQISYLNLPIIKQISQIWSAYREVKRILKEKKQSGDEVVLLGFNMFPQVGLPMKWLRNQVKTVCLLADLPIDDNTNRKGFSRFLRKIFDHNTLRNMQMCDNYIVLSECVKKEILSDKNVLVVEGGVEDKDILEVCEAERNNEKKTIVFGGALTEYNGILNLLDCMKYVHQENVELQIYGNGYLKEYVMEKQKQDTRIQYMGQVSNEEMKKIQREVDILINPRQVDNQISKYTFPSKTFEYFLSKTIVISTRIPSYPEEYLDKMVLAEDSAEGLAEAINRVLVMSQEDKRDIEGRAFQFVACEKRWSSQAERIYEYIKTLAWQKK